MGKMLELFDIIDGYNIKQIWKLRVKRDKLFDEISKYDSKIKEETRQIVNTSTGIVYAIVKKGSIKGIYLFTKETKNNIKSLKNIKTVYIDEITEDTQRKCDNHIAKLLEEHIIYDKYEIITLKDKVIQIDPKKTKKEKFILMLIGFIIGFVVASIIFHDFYYGILFGIIDAPVFSRFQIIVTNKRGRKKY